MKKIQSMYLFNIDQCKHIFIFQIEFDISKKYKNRPVYIIGTSIFGS